MPGPSRRLYFAYGSNLSLAQMAKRCPASYYIGRAVLPDYRWQINQRGYANVVAAPGSSVHGLVFELLDDDEARLDRNEGVHAGAYAKALLGVVLHPAPLDLQLKTRRVVQEGLLRAPPFASSSSREGGWPPRFEEGVLVYLSERFVRQGSPRDEYVDRINTGVRDAVALGVPEAYFDNAVRASVPRRTLSVVRRAPRTPPPRGRPTVVRRPTTTRAQSVGVRGMARSSGAEERGDSEFWERGGTRRQSWTPNPTGYLHSGYVRQGPLEDRGSYLLVKAMRSD
ncbi:hypothetical protein NEMBOFW57_003902 [Staphylotrichum longicolle]|uniref:gamma-glutamylcyclotransferase n=1 Tax=Staphylotrichum longicolle TaxID=669026 RepID=A0AAD4F8N9_9PEZI|nr:hypothetical protein NEMBOFW57_003902 [Staphylotrichum longicolle]